MTWEEMYNQKITEISELISDLNDLAKAFKDKDKDYPDSPREMLLKRCSLDGHYPKRCMRALLKLRVVSWDDLKRLSHHDFTGLHNYGKGSHAYLKDECAKYGITIANWVP